MADRRSSSGRSTIWVVAGPNGGGKSSIFGEMVREAGADYFNPDEYCDRLVVHNPGLVRDAANIVAWEQGRRRLEHAIDEDESFAFETTLGGKTITRLLLRAMARGTRVKISYVACGSAGVHVARVQARAGRGGHDIPEELVRERYDRSRVNLVRLLPSAAAVKVYDNDVEVDVEADQPPRLRLVLDYAAGSIRNENSLARTPEWAKPIVAAALKAQSRRPH